MKKKISAILTVIMIVTTAVTAFAAFNNEAVVDRAGYLDKSRFNEITNKLEDVRRKYDFDVAIYTEKTMSGTDAQSTADDLFDYTGYGYGKNADGIMLYIAADEREYYLTTHGTGEKIFNERGLVHLEEMILPSLRENDYYSAMKFYAEGCEELLEMAAQGKPYNKKTLTKGYVCGVIGGAVLVPLLLAYLMMSMKLKKMKTAVQNNFAANYMKPGSMKLSLSRDIFLYSTVTKTPKPKANSGSHTSSSRESHGGRGGSF